jgi:hypothetical protein
MDLLQPAGRLEGELDIGIEEQVALLHLARRCRRRVAEWSRFPVQTAVGSAQKQSILASSGVAAGQVTTTRLPEGLPSPGVLNGAGGLRDPRVASFRHHPEEGPRWSRSATGYWWSRRRSAPSPEAAWSRPWRTG